MSGYGFHRNLSRHLAPKTAAKISLLATLIISMLVLSPAAFAQEPETTTTTVPETTPAPTTTIPDDIDTELPGQTAPQSTVPPEQKTVAQQKARQANRELDKKSMRLLEAQLAADKTSLEIQETRALLSDLKDKISQSEARLALRELPLSQLDRIIKKRAITMYQQTSGSPTDPLERFLFKKQTALSSSAQKRNVTDFDKFEKDAKELKRIKKELSTQKKEAETRELQLQDLSVEFAKQLELARNEYEKTATIFLDAYAVVGAKLAVEGKMCPIAGPMTHVPDFGNPRSGGRRHKGNDVFNAFGTPNVAIVDGVIQQQNGGLAGQAVKLFGDDGHTYFYAHLSAFAGKPRRVTQGEVIGFTGDTGNAKGGAPHTHFEIRIGGTQHIDPYPTLRLICGV